MRSSNTVQQDNMHSTHHLHCCFGCCNSLPAGYYQSQPLVAEAAEDKGSSQGGVVHILDCMHTAGLLVGGIRSLEGRRNLEGEHHSLEEVHHSQEEGLGDSLVVVLGSLNESEVVIKSAWRV